MAKLLDVLALISWALPQEGRRHKFAAAYISASSVLQSAPTPLIECSANRLCISYRLFAGEVGIGCSIGEGAPFVLMNIPPPADLVSER